MSLLERLRPDALRSDRASAGGAGAPAAGARPIGLLAALGIGGAAAGVCWLAVTLPALLGWATSSQSDASWADAVRVASDLWLVLHRVQVQVPGGAVSLAPLGGTAVPVWVCWIAGRRIGAAGVGGSSGRGPSARAVLRALGPAVGMLAAGYALVLTAIAALAGAPGYRPVVWQAAVAGSLLALLSAGAAAVRAAGLPFGATLADAAGLPERVRRAVRPAVGAAAALVAAGALLTAVALALHLTRIAALHDALAPGVVGGAVLTVAQAALVPNLALWGTAFLAGPGFALGTGTLVSPGGSSLGLLPLVPVLGAVPPPGRLPTAMWSVVAVPVLVGVGLGWCSARSGRASSVWQAVADAAVAVAGCVLVLAGLLALSGGAAGPGTLAAVGPSPWRTALVLTAELSAGALCAAWLTHRRTPS